MPYFQHRTHRRTDVLTSPVSPAITRSEQEVIPILPDAETIDALELAPGTPILEKISRGFLSDGRIFEYSRNAFKSDDYRFTLVARRQH